MIKVKDGNIFAYVCLIKNCKTYIKYDRYILCIKSEEQIIERSEAHTFKKKNGKAPSC